MKAHEWTRLLAWSLSVGLFTLESVAQTVSAAQFPSAPSATGSTEVQVSSPGCPFPGGAPPQQTQTAQPQDSGSRLGTLIKRGARDQKEIYLAPLHRENLKWDALFLVATGGLIAADKHVTGALSHDNLSVSQHISDVGLYSSVATTGAMLVSGLIEKNQHARETGILGFEAFANTLAVSAVTQLIAGRERPLEGEGHGRFWVNNALDSSFPSMHSSLSWSMMSVVAHEYPRPWVQFLVYGTATTVSVTRVSGLKHFPADVAVGGVFGYFIGRHIFRAHSSLSRTPHR